MSNPYAVNVDWHPDMNRFADFKGLKKASKVRNALMKEYMYTILIQSLQYWSKHPNDIDEIAETIRDIQLKGIRKVIHLDEH